MLDSGEFPSPRKLASFTLRRDGKATILRLPTPCKTPMYLYHCKPLCICLVSVHFHLYYLSTLEFESVAYGFSYINKEIYENCVMK